MNNYTNRYQIQLAEQRSIAIFEPSEGPQSLPAAKIDRSVFWKNNSEKKNVKKAFQEFKNSGELKSWNERNRPGNNK